MWTIRLRRNHRLVAVAKKLSIVTPMPRVTPCRLRFCSLPVFAAMLLLAGCATSYKVEVNSITSPNMTPATTYALVTRDPNLPQRDLEYYMVADRVRTALAEKGMYEAPVPEEADIIVEIDYGERAPKTKVTNVQSTQIVPPNPLGVEIDPLTGRPYPPTIVIGGPGSGVYPGGGVYPGTYPGQYPYPYPSTRAQTITTQEQRITTVSEKYIRLTATENIPPSERARRRPAQLWIVEALVEDEDSSVHECMPPMVSALTDFIGVSSGGKHVVTVAAEE